MAKPTDTHPVLVAHLEGLVTVLDAAFGLSMAEDLQRRYRNLEGQVRPTSLTRALEGARDRWESYLEEAQKVEKPAEVQPDE
jgi:hypothetical protein